VLKEEYKDMGTTKLEVAKRDH